MALKMKEHKQYKIIYYQQTTKHSEINQHDDRKNVGIQKVYSSILRESYDQKLQRAFRQAPRANPGEAAIANSEKAVEDNEMGKMLCQLVKKQSDSTVDIEESHGSPLQYSYFRSIFQELVEKKIDK